MKTKTTHTPGPWEVVREPGTDRLSIYGKGSQSDVIADVFLREEHRANAALIAAAPEMLEALRDVLIEQDTDLSCELAEQIQQAIAKAEGKIT